MKYFKTVYITFKTINGELQTITINCFKQTRQIKQQYRIGGGIYSFGKIVKVEVKVNRAMEMTKDRIIKLHKLGGKNNERNLD